MQITGLKIKNMFRRLLEPVGKFWENGRVAVCFVEREKSTQIFNSLVNTFFHTENTRKRRKNQIIYEKNNGKILWNFK